MVVFSRLGSNGVARALELLTMYDFVVVPVDNAIAELAVSAFERFGKGRHPAGLNFGDCFSYALAKQLALPLLFKGNDFTKTDVINF